ncbi:hypothetical protein, partial [Salmonella sp. s51228]|uniref:hypothetical protein n=1 Tax=Salmonella sp. s51228 TaxID=3159652 RepID=UPI0039805DDC
MAAKTQYSLSEIYEAVGDLPKASEHYLKAADFYSGEESISSSNKCRHKAATLYALRGEFLMAIKLFDYVIQSSLKSKLLSYSVKDYMFKA